MREGPFSIHGTAISHGSSLSTYPEVAPEYCRSGQKKKKKISLPRARDSTADKAHALHESIWVWSPALHTVFYTVQKSPEKQLFCRWSRDNAMAEHLLYKFASWRLNTIPNMPSMTKHFGIAGTEIKCESSNTLYPRSMSTPQSLRKGNGRGWRGESNLLNWIHKLPRLYFIRLQCSNTESLESSHSGAGQLPTTNTSGNLDNHSTFHNCCHVNSQPS